MNTYVWVAILWSKVVRTSRLVISKCWWMIFHTCMGICSSLFVKILPRASSWIIIQYGIDICSWCIKMNNWLRGEQSWIMMKLNIISQLLVKGPYECPFKLKSDSHSWAMWNECGGKEMEACSCIRKITILPLYYVYKKDEYKRP